MATRKLHKKIHVCTFELGDMLAFCTITKSIPTPPSPTPTTPAATTPSSSPGTGSTSGSGKTLTEDDWTRATVNLIVDVESIKAVAQVESAGGGFLPDGRPKILYEAHLFSALTNHVYDTSNPSISSRHWNKSLYKGGAGEYPRLEEAMNLDKDAALKSASWGRFQIIGKNHAACGYSNVEDFVNAMNESEGKQLDAFVSFIKADAVMYKALKKHDWAAFAAKYNGKEYKKNKYDEKLESAYNKLKGIN
jgi:hypothetical protein